MLPGNAAEMPMCERYRNVCVPRSPAKRAAWEVRYQATCRNGEYALSTKRARGEEEHSPVHSPAAGSTQLQAAPTTQHPPAVQLTSEWVQEQISRALSPLKKDNAALKEDNAAIQKRLDSQEHQLKMKADSSSVKELKESMEAEVELVSVHCLKAKQQASLF